MTRFLLVAAGGALGSMARYGLVLLMSRLTPGAGWPLATFTANVLAMGLLVGWLAFRGDAHQETIRLFAAVGVLGGFTTFSTYSLEAALMLERRDYGLAAAYIVGSVVLAVVALFIGMVVARRAFGAAI
jgi:CrcB protein